MQLHAVFSLPYKDGMVSSCSTPASPGTANAGFCCMLPVCAVGPALFWLAVQNSCFLLVQIPAGKFHSGSFCKALEDSVYCAYSCWWGFILSPLPPPQLWRKKGSDSGARVLLWKSFWSAVDAFRLKSSLFMCVCENTVSASLFALHNP